MVLFNKFIRIKQLLIFALLAFVIAGCASTPRSGHDGFDEPRKMAPMITFWENVYATWDTGVVVFHDNYYMDVIYDIAVIPRGDRAMWDATSTLIYQDLVAVEESLTSPKNLTSSQTRLKNMLLKAGGQAAIIGAPERLRGQRGLKSEFRAGLERSQRYIPYFKKVMRSEGLPEDIAYLPHVESSFNSGARSKVGAAGMWQFMPSTARSFMPMRANVIDSRFDPYHAAQGAARLMKYNHGLVPYWPLVITGYNSGIGHGIRAKERYGHDIGTIVYNYNEGAFQFASRNFYAEFIAAKRIAKNPERYFPGFRYQFPKSNIEGIQLTEPMKLQDLAREVGLPASLLEELNPAWLRNIVTNRSEIPASYDIWLPKGTMKRIHHQPFYRPSKIQP